MQLPDWMSPNHAVQMPNGHFMVAHIAAAAELNRDGISEVDATGALVKTYSGHRGNGPNQFNRPSHLALKADGGVIVADFENRRVVGVDAGLTTGTVLLEKAQLESRQSGGDDDNPSGRPWRLAIDNSAGHLYVGIAAGKVKIYSI